FWILVSWQLGLTLAVIAIIADTIYRARKGYAGKIRLTAAQRRTRRQLNKLGRAGYRAMHARPIPESQDQIDHLVVGPAGVFAIDSENWDKRLAVRTKKGTQLWHGPFSKKDRLQHAQWEAQRAADLLTGATGKPVSVRAAMAVYGPRIPWDVATIREVDVCSGPRLRQYMRRRDLLAELTSEEAEQVWRDRWREAITNPPTSRHRVLAAVDGGPSREVAGFASAGPATDADRWPGIDGEVYELRISPERTGQGHGSRLLHAVADTLIEDGFHTVSIWALEA